MSDESRPRTDVERIEEALNVLFDVANSARAGYPDPDFERHSRDETLPRSDRGRGLSRSVTIVNTSNWEYEDVEVVRSARGWIAGIDDAEAGRQDDHAVHGGQSSR